MLTLHVAGIGILGPGFDGWDTSRALFVGERAYKGGDTAEPRSTWLSPTERRRTSYSTRLAMHVAQQALEQSGLPGDELATVFASSDGDTAILHQLCSALALPEKAVSPTAFHNSVHNAPAGYWSIATGSHASSNSLSCYDATFVTGLLDAACQATVEHRPVLLNVYDMKMPQPLDGARPIGVSFAVALVLLPQASPTGLTRLDIDLRSSDASPESTLEQPAMESLRHTNPAARALPLLAALARTHASEVVLPYVNGNCVHVQVTP
jgi:hypothetical protein